jgi:hypothetical protein
LKKLLIAIAAILILAGGAVAAMKWLQIGPFASTEMATEAKEEPEEDKEDSIFVDLDPDSGEVGNIGTGQRDLSETPPDKN